MNRPATSDSAGAGSSGPRWWRSRWAGMVLISVLTIVVYAPALRGGYLWDDDFNVTRPELRSWEGLFRIWFEPRATQQYYPLLHSSFWLQQKLLGDSAWGCHLVGILLHIGCALLFMKILERMKVPGALFAAAVFALHPVHVESVAWITERKNTLSGIFCLASVLWYLRFDDTRNWRDYAIAFLLFVLGLLSKTAIVALPLALLAIFWWKRGTLAWKRDLRPLAPFFLASVALGLMTIWIERGNIGIDARQLQFSAIDRCLIAGRAAWFHLWKLVWPLDLVFVYPRWEISAGVWWQYLFPAAFLLMLGILWRLRRWSRGPLAGMLVFVALSLPTMGFINQYFFVYSFVSDHWQYLPSLGIIALMGAGAARGVKRATDQGREIAWGICGLVLLGLGSLSWRQSAMYRDDETLFRATIERNPACWMAHNNLGNLLSTQGRQDDAIEHYRETLRVKPDHIEAHYNWANVLVARGDLEGAIEHYEEALEIEPALAEAHYNLGLVLAKQGKFAEAIVRYTRALELKPDYADAHCDLGLALAARGEFPGAISHYQQAIELKPGYAVAHYNWGLAAAAQGRNTEAAGHYQRALQLKPDFVEALSNLGAVLAAEGRTEEAVGRYRQALSARPGYAPAHNNLGLILASENHLDEAVAHFREALKSQPDYAVAHYNLGLALTALRQYAEAGIEYERAAQLRPDLPEAREKLGQALAAQGRHAEAVEAFRRALQLRSVYPEAQAGLERELKAAGKN